MKLSVITDRQIAARLSSYYSAATAEQKARGIVWYSDAQSIANGFAEEFNVSPYQCAAVIAALSPNNKWSRNVIDAHSLISAFVSGESIDSFKVCTYSANKRKAWSILRDGAVIAAGSPKTHAFAMNVGLLSPDHVTIDLWHLRACSISHSHASLDRDAMMSAQTSVTTKQYRRIEAITAALAHRHGLKGYEMQAIIWLVIRELHS